jgi:hypothetical protein
MNSHKSAKHLTARLSLWGLIASLGILAGCETVEGYRQKLNLWVGRSADSLQIEWGVPDKQTVLSDGSELFVYRRIKESTTGGYWTSHTRQRTETIIVNDKPVTRQVSYTVPYYEPPVTQVYRCETRFVIKDEKVISHSFEGNGCVAEEMKKNVASETSKSQTAVKDPQN